jgi:hypothetical protein
MGRRIYGPLKWGIWERFPSNSYVDLSKMRRANGSPVKLVLEVCLTRAGKEKGGQSRLAFFSFGGADVRCGSSIGRLSSVVSCGEAGFHDLSGVAFFVFGRWRQF